MLLADTRAAEEELEAVKGIVAALQISESQFQAIVEEVKRSPG
jgi:hypothetical protein